MRSWIFVPPLSGRATCLVMGLQHPVYFIIIHPCSELICQSSHPWLSECHIAGAGDTKHTRTLYWWWILHSEMKTRKEKGRKVWCKNYVADVGHWHSQVLWDHLLFGCYSILISFQHQHWSSQHIKWTEHRSCVYSVFVHFPPITINRRLVPRWWGVRGQQSAHATPACLLRSEACH